MREVAALWTAAALLLPVPAAAQADTPLDPDTGLGSIEGRVTIPEGTGLADVSISVLGRDRGTVTDVAGRFTLRRLEAGSVELRFERLGYGSHTVSVDVRTDGVTRVETTLAPSTIELDPIEVRVGAAFLNANGFYQRVRRGFGLQISREELEAMHMLEVSDAMRDISGVILNHDPYMATRVIATRPRGPRIGGQDCALTVYVDGVRTLDPNLNQVPPDWLLGMEVYLGAQTPVKFRTAGDCGVVLLWTKDGR